MPPDAAVPEGEDFSSGLRGIPTSTFEWPPFLLRYRAGLTIAWKSAGWKKREGEIMMTAMSWTGATDGTQGSSTLLVVEDDANDVLLIRRGLSKTGVGDQVRVARDGEEAVAYLKGEGSYQDRALYPLPALMTLDLKLPRKSGLEVLEWIRNDPRFKDLPVVILTSSKEVRDVARTRELGVIDYHVKPMDYKEFTELVKSIGLLWMTLAK